MKAQKLHLLPSSVDEKRWVAEITGDDPTFRLKREFQPEISEGVWELYDGFYQIHGEAQGVSSFQKEYVWIHEGRMVRHLAMVHLIQRIPEMKAAEPMRRERLKRQLFHHLDEIKAAAPCQPVEEAIEQQKEACELVETSSELLGAYAMLLKQKKNMMKEYQQHCENYKEFY